MKKWFRSKLTFLVVAFLVIYWLYLSWDVVGMWAESVPLLGSVVIFVKQHIFQKTLLGAFLMSFIGGLFFVFLPLEVIFIFFSTGNLWFMIPLLFVGNLLGLLFDYGCGYLVGPWLGRKLFKQRYEPFQKWTEKAGWLILLAGHLLFFPMQAISVVVGSSRYGFKKFLLFTVVGTLLKFGLMLYLLSSGFF